MEEIYANWFEYVLREMIQAVRGTLTSGLRNGTCKQVNHYLWEMKWQQLFGELLHEKKKKNPTIQDLELFQVRMHKLATFLFTSHRVPRLRLIPQRFSVNTYQHSLLKFSRVFCGVCFFWLKSITWKFILVSFNILFILIVLNKVLYISLNSW